MGRRPVVISLLALLAACTASAPKTASSPTRPQPAVSSSLHLVGSIRVPGTPEGDLLVRASGLWVSTCGRSCNGPGPGTGGRVLRIDPQTGRVLSSLPIQNPETPIAAFGSIWVADFSPATVTRIDEETGRVLATIRLRLPGPPFPGPAEDRHAFVPSSIAAGSGIWVSTARGYVAHIDPKSNRVVGYTPLPPENTGVVAVSADAVWTAEDLAGVYRVDPRTGAVTKTVISRPPETRLAVNWLAVGGGKVWAWGDWAPGGTASNDFALVALDSNTGRIILREPSPAGELLPGGSSLWLVDGPNFTRLDPRTGSLSRTYHLPRPGRVVAVTPETAWSVTERMIQRWKIVLQ